MKITEQRGYIIFGEEISPLIKQVVILLKDNAVSREEEALEITKSMVSRYMKKYKRTKFFTAKKFILCMGFLILGILIGVFV
jgi:hypothetical protein